MEQVTFADVEYEGKKRRTRRELFLERMEALIPWERLEARIRPLYPKAGRGRQPYPLAALLRVHCVQLFYNLSDPGMEDMLYEIESVRRFAGLRLTGPLPDETTILNFRHLLERHGLGRGLFEEINAHLAERGYRVRAGTIVDASIIAAPSLELTRFRGHIQTAGTEVSTDVEEEGSYTVRAGVPAADGRAGPGGAHAGRAGARVRAHSEHDPEMGRAAGPGRGIARGWANERGAD